MVDDWFVKFVNAHIKRHPGVGLPAIDSTDGESLYAAWRTVFIKRGIHDHEIATEASELLTAEKRGGPRDHFPRLVALALDLYRARAAAAGPTGADANSREGAERASRGCERCGGCGMTVVFHPRPDPANRVAATVGAHCVCPHGRWIRRRIGEQSPALLRRIPDFGEAPAGRSGWLSEAPRDFAPLEARR